MPAPLPGAWGGDRALEDTDSVPQDHKEPTHHVHTSLQPSALDKGLDGVHHYEMFCLLDGDLLLSLQLLKFAAFRMRFVPVVRTPKDQASPVYKMSGETGG